MLDPDDPRHGTAAYYGHHGCRCDACRQANTEKRRRDRGGPETRSIETKETRMLDEEWRDKAGCKGMDPNLFHPAKGGDHQAPKRICHECPVEPECREFALSQGLNVQGVWGGTTDRERRRIRAERRRAERILGGVLAG